MRVVGTSLLLLVGVGGCGQSECDHFSGCPVVDADGGPDDYAVELAAGAVFSFRANGRVTPRALLGGEVVFSTEPRDCDFSVACQLTVKRLELRFGDVPLDLSDGSHMVAEDLVARLDGPVEAEATDAVAYVIPAGAKFQTCVAVDGERDHGVSSAKAIMLRLSRYPNEQLSVDNLSLDLVFHANDDDCSELRVPLAGRASGTAPWQVPAP